VKEKLAWPLAVMAVFALTRIPGVLPENFSAAYALVFCAGAFLPARLAWWLPLATLAVTDLLLNLHYRFNLGWDVFAGDKLFYLAGNYLAYGAILLLGRRFQKVARTQSLPSAGFFGRLAAWCALLGGGLLSAVIFYLVTNTLAWLFNPFGNPEYTKTIQGWIQALTGGTAGWPATWEFFRNSLGSGGLFAGLFAAAMQLGDALEAREQEPAEEAEPEETPEPQPGEAKA
jgi:hypothetical protein